MGKHYGECYIKDHNLFRSIEWLANQLPGYPQNIASKQRYDNEFRGKLYCPECQEARLYLRTRKDKSYLSAIRSNEHKTGCSYASNSATTKRSISSMKYKRFSRKELCSVINELISGRPESPQNENSPKKLTKNSGTFLSNSTRKSARSKSIPRKSLDTLDQLEENSLFLVYGRAEIYEKPENDGYHIWFNDANSTHLLDIRCSKEVHDELIADSQYSEAIRKKNCLLAAYCDIKINRGKFRVFRNSWINGPENIMIIPTP